MALKMLIHTTGHLKSTCRKGVASQALTSMLWGRFYTQQLLNSEEKDSRENESLLSTLQLMGVDVSRTRRVYPSVLRKGVTYERSLQEFLLEKGADRQMIANLIPRYPRAINHKYDVLCEMWDIWKSVLNEDSVVLNVVERSPESFFRTANINNLKRNLHFFQSIGMPPKVLSLLMVKAPRTFSNTVQLNQQKVFFLQRLCVSLGGKNPLVIVRQLIARNIYILTRSTKRINSNIEAIRSLMKLDDESLLLWIQGDGAHLLSLSYTYIEKNVTNAQEKLQALGFSEAEISRYIYMCPKVLLMTPENFANKIDLLLECDIEAREILNTPNILGMRVNCVERKIKDLSKYGYDFKSSGLGILNLSSRTFKSKLQTLYNFVSLDHTDKKC